ncbi:alpha/beta hydrolase family protein [Occallatibacter riparius]|uniref:Alpha/beta hydrolase fold domain-containing protein n=1 Tax=Occallatibacter riparius TaxID=1002689 RepID=A0A9J7BK69_9BACT|nr:alpha/beta hydrolase fold domain-containing protein [Occallatibacter riparius]UWZ82841.1 alpha/beta hydrolase fold domain-containing protein [Occallatibacter riparius]
MPSNPAPTNAPVVIFCHGFSAILPRGYQAWIDHLVSRGNIVLWPNYQDNLRVPTRGFVPNALAGVKAGLHILQSGPGGVLPDLERVAVVGHSAGGMVAAGIAASASAEGLPKVKALMPVEPGDSRRGGVASVPLADLSTLPDDILLLILVGEDDTSVATFDGERILHESTSVPAENKALFMLHSDSHGSPALVANHFTPTAVLNTDGSFAKTPVRPGVSRNTMNIGVVDAFDYMGTWRLLDRLLGAAFSDAPRDQLFRDRSLMLMGKWSDGVPVVPLTRLN